MKRALQSKDTTPTRDLESFKYLIGTKHVDDEKGILYETTRFEVKRNNDIAIFRKSVASDGSLYSKEDGPIHARDIEILTNNSEAIKLTEMNQRTSAKISESRPIYTNTDCSDNSRGRKVAIPGKQDRVCRTTASRT